MKTPEHTSSTIEDTTAAEKIIADTTNNKPAINHDNYPTTDPKDIILKEILDVMQFIKNALSAQLMQNNDNDPEKAEIPQTHQDSDISHHMNNFMVVFIGNIEQAMLQEGMTEKGMTESC